MNLGVFKGKQVAAKKGYDLLKSKADALKVIFLDYISLNVFDIDCFLRFAFVTFAKSSTTLKLEWLINQQLPSLV